MTAEMTMGYEMLAGISSTMSAAKALTGRLMGLVARAVQRGQSTVAQVGGQQCGQQQSTGRAP